MKGVLRSAASVFAHVFFVDPARPMEWLSLLGLAGWAWAIVATPDLFSRPQFSGFGGSVGLWLFVMVAVIGAQLAAMLPRLAAAPLLRFVAMSVAAALWTVVAGSFWASPDAVTAKAIYTATALMTALCGVFLGWTSSNSR